MTTSSAHDSPAAALRSSEDPAFPLAHPRPASGWLNDPNGLCRVDGVWHVFFQYNPDSAQHRNVHWGHLSSPDLVAWTEEPVALAPPEEGPDRAGCWSGVMGFDGGGPVAVYSGVQRFDGPSQVTLVRGSSDLRQWGPDRHVAAGMPDDERVTAVRDPFLLTIGGRRWALQGAGLADGRAAVLLYDADDLWHWTYCGIWLDSAEAPADVDAEIWECPQLVPFEDAGCWALIICRWHADEDGVTVRNSTRALLLDVADPTSDDPVPRPTVRGTAAVDDGDSFYAPQVLVDDDRVLLVGWARERRSQEASDAAGWAGLLTWPRELSLRGGRLISTPAPECDGWRTGESRQHRTGPGTSSAVELPSACDVLVEADTPGGASVRLIMLDDHGDPLETAFSGRAERLVIDHSIVEIYRPDGAACTLRVEPHGGQLWRLEVEEEATVTWWELRRWSPAPSAPC